MLTFVGRPGDSNKGLENFLEALNLLANVSELPSFGVWLIGGSERELCTIDAWVAARPGVNRLQRRGVFLIWGRIAPDALPEMLSRSSVVVMPSNREQFGIVAIEAMMCGCPVLASRTGGLPDIVVEGRVGHLVTPGDHSALAFALLGILRAPKYWQILGQQATRWAGKNFSQETVFQRLRQLYKGEVSPKAHCIEAPQEWFVPTLDDAQRLFVERLLGPLRRIVLLGESHGGATFAVESSDHKVVVKVIGSYPDLRNSLFSSHAWLVDEFAAYQAKSNFLSKSELVPAVIASDAQQRILIRAWVEGSPTAMTDMLFARISRLCVPSMEHCEALAIAIESLRRQRTVKALFAADQAASALNAECAGGSLWVHPAIELERVRMHLDRHYWPFNKRLRFQLQKRILDHIEALGDIDGVPALCHGDPRPAHFLSKGDSCRFIGLRKLHFAVGPLDAVRWRLFGDDRPPAAGLGGALSVAWTAVEAFAEALCMAVRGNSRPLIGLPAFLGELLRSPEIAFAHECLVDIRQDEQSGR